MTHSSIPFSFTPSCPASSILSPFFFISTSHFYLCFLMSLFLETPCHSFSQTSDMLPFLIHSLHPVSSILFILLFFSLSLLLVSLRHFFFLGISCDSCIFFLFSPSIYAFPSLIFDSSLLLLFLFAEVSVLENYYLCLSILFFSAILPHVFPSLMFRSIPFSYFLDFVISFEAVSNSTLLSFLFSFMYSVFL